MGTRLELQSILEDLLGSRNVHFQPPEDLSIQYPAIVYSLGGLENIHANDRVYKQSLRYEVTVIDANPDNEIYKQVSVLPMCRFDRHFKSDNLNHYVFTLYF